MKVMKYKPGNSRLARTFEKALGMKLGEGIYPINSYDDSVILTDVMFTISTRISAANEFFLLEVYEDEEYSDSPLRPQR